jgi:hypothetical protein
LKIKKKFEKVENLISWYKRYIKNSSEKKSIILKTNKFPEKGVPTISQR